MILRSHEISRSSVTVYANQTGARTRRVGNGAAAMNYWNLAGLVVNLIGALALAWPLIFTGERTGADSSV
jgi:uncharacterized membrane protein